MKKDLKNKKWKVNKTFIFLIKKKNSSSNQKLLKHYLLINYLILKN